MNLFDSATFLHRRNDPLTSVVAAAEIVDRVPGLTAWASQCVKLSPGLTRRELGAKYSPDDANRIGRRLDGAVKDGLIRRGSPRKCSVSGKTATTWFPVEIQS